MQPPNSVRQGYVYMNKNTQQEFSIQEDKPLIWIACLAAYNNGKLHGRWIDASQGEEYVWDEIKDVLKTSPEPDAEEWAIHDYQGFHGYRVSESHSIDKLCEVAELIWEAEEESEGKGKVVAELIEDYNVDGAREMLEDNFIGCFEKEDDFIYQHVEDCCLLEGVSETVKRYFDYDALLRDMKLNGEILTIEANWNEIYFFYNR